MYYTSKEVYEFISKQAYDPITQWKQCKISGADFPIYQSDLDFYDKISPKFSTDKENGDKLISEKPNFFSRDENGKLKVKIPTPTLCPEERQRRRLLFRNERKLYKRKCDATGENIISIYSPDKDLKVYKQDFWWSDGWDPMDYCENFNFGGKFDEQYDKLIKKTPQVNLYVKNSENCEYNSVVTDSKNCYLSTSTGYVENVFYSTLTGWLKNCCDSHWLLHSENCYECTDCDKCYNCHYLLACTNCSDCLYCSNIHNKKFCILNQQYTKEEYEIKIKNYINQRSEKKRRKLIQQQTRSNYIKNSENSTGSMIRNCSNTNFAFDVVDCHDSKYLLISGLSINNIYDCSGGDIFQSEMCYECGLIPMNHGLISCYSCRESKNLYYCFNCFSCSDCFGCVGLRNKQYCIFNKQYTKEEYNNLIPQIINNMIDEGTRGEFFDPSLSPFGYNETVAQEYFPLTRQEALDRGYKRQDNNYDPVVPEHIQTLKGDQIPTDISTVTDDILKKILVCEVSERPFRIVKQELEFYRKHNLPLPRKHPDVRHQERLKQRPPRELHLRNCDKCGKEMVSVYDKSFEGKVYCEECYQKEIY